MFHEKIPKFHHSLFLYHQKTLDPSLCEAEASKNNTQNYWDVQYRRDLEHRLTLHQWPGTNFPSSD